MGKAIFANIFGQAIVAAISLLAIPIYLKYLGAEAYGLISFFTLIQLWASLLDFGTSSTITREVASLKQGKYSKSYLVSILIGVKRLAITISISLTILGIFLSNLIASEWLKIGSLEKQDVVISLYILGVIAAGRIWEDFYKGILRGKEDVAWINIFQVLYVLVRTIGSILIIILFDQRITTFFVWQCIIGICGLIVLQRRVSYILPVTKEAKIFASIALSDTIKTWKFSFGISFTATLGVFISQLDKFLLSGILPIKDYAVYMLASLLAGMLSQIIGPINLSLYPKFSSLFASGDNNTSKFLFEKSTQLVNVLISSVGAFCFIYSDILLCILTYDVDIANNVSEIFKILIIGAMLNAYVNLPYLIHQSQGIAKYGIVVNGVSLIILIPLITYLVPKYGVISAAYIWLILNSGYFFISLVFIFKEKTHGNIYRWYMNVFQSIVMAMSISMGFNMLIEYYFGNDLIKYFLPLIFLTVVISNLFTQPIYRLIIVNLIKKRI